MLSEGFMLLLTFNKNIKDQQNFQKYPIPVLTINTSGNDYLTLSTIIPKIKSTYY